jgi:D-lactate dehydrogenase
LWQTRKALSPALRKVAPKKINEDVVVPVTEIPTLIAGLDELSKHYQLPIINFGHAGNGNIHVNLLLNPDDPEQSARAHRCLDEIFSLVLKLNGTLSGEHGVGLEKRDFVDRELDANSLELMRAIKRQFDPKGILNAGKMLPLE